VCAGKPVICLIVDQLFEGCVGLVACSVDDLARRYVTEEHADYFCVVVEQRYMQR
jgi:hypothetical protein